MTDPRLRMAAVAGSLALSMSLTLAPAVMAQDGPEATIQSFMDTLVAKDFEALPAFFCEEQAEQAAQFDVSSLAGDLPEGMDVQSLLDAFIFDISVDSMEVVSQTETDAVVHVIGSMSMDLDEEALVPFVEAIIEMSGMEADEATVEMFLGLMASEFEAQSEDIDDAIELVAGDDGGWLICSDLDFTSSDTTDGDAMPTDTPEPSVEEVEDGE
jgi:hypothetical protein